MRTKRRQLEVIAGALDMTTQRILWCNDPRTRAVRGAGAGSGFCDIIFPEDFRVVSAVGNPSAANFSIGISVPTTTPNQQQNSIRFNTQSPPNTTNADSAFVTFIAYGYGGGGGGS